MKHYRPEFEAMVSKFLKAQGFVQKGAQKVFIRKDFQISFKKASAESYQAHIEFRKRFPEGKEFRSMTHYSVNHTKHLKPCFNDFKGYYRSFWENAKNLTQPGKIILPGKHN